MQPEHDHAHHCTKFFFLAVFCVTTVLWKTLLLTTLGSIGDDDTSLLRPFNTPVRIACRERSSRMFRNR